jgi:hypothetical protein
MVSAVAGLHDGKVAVLRFRLKSPTLGEMFDEGKSDAPDLGAPFAWNVLVAVKSLIAWALKTGKPQSFTVEIDP